MKWNEAIGKKFLWEGKGEPHEVLSAKRHGNVLVVRTRCGKVITERAFLPSTEINLRLWYLASFQGASSVPEEIDEDVEAEDRTEAEDKTDTPIEDNTDEPTTED